MHCGASRCSRIVLRPAGSPTFRITFGEAAQTVEARWLLSFQPSPVGRVRLGLTANLPGRFPSSPSPQWLCALLTIGRAVSETYGIEYSASRLPL